ERLTACIRALIYSQDARKRNGPLPQRELWDHPGPRRFDLGREHTRNRHHFHDSAPALCRDEEVTRILIVDDEETIRLALRKFLRSRGYEVEIAGSGDQALEILEREPLSLMLCDVRMPG